MSNFEFHVDPITGQAYITIGGVRVEIRDEHECEQATFVICAAESHFPDDVYTLCALCGAGIVHRPHAPKRPPKICLTCVVRLESNPKH